MINSDVAGSDLLADAHLKNVVHPNAFRLSYDLDLELWYQFRESSLHYLPVTGKVVYCHPGCSVIGLMFALPHVLNSGDEEGSDAIPTLHTPCALHLFANFDARATILEANSKRQTNALTRLVVV